MKIITLNHGQECKVDDEDYERFKDMRWSITNSGYANNKIGYMHRIIAGAGANFQVDHINHDKLDNRRDNLRVCTRSQNTANRNRQPNNTSGYKGVTWDKYTKRWMAKIQINSKSINLGRYDNPEDAARTYDEAAKKYFGEFSITNDN